MTETQARVVKLLEAHRFVKALGQCSCGLELPVTGNRPGEYRSHLASILVEELDLEPDPGPCDAEVHSWDHFRPEQVDSYWITCSLRMGHDGNHEDSNTGLTWVDTVTG